MGFGGFYMVCLKLFMMFYAANNELQKASFWGV